MSVREAKEHDVWWDVQGHYGFRWEHLSSESTPEEADETLAIYNENEPQYPHRVRRMRGDAQAD